jgi:1-acyl-sn-glycerol-3-phosphate acyltransferase
MCRMRIIGNWRRIELHRWVGSELRMPLVWYRVVWRLICKVYFSRLTLLHGERRPAPGHGVLYVGLHRNGAVDGFVYAELLGDPTFLISTQLTRGWFARLFFRGIAVTRRQDAGDHEDNDASLQRCVELLRAGGVLFVFPEGTSTLGPRHLPFKSGAARIVLDCLERGDVAFEVIPAGVHYECPWAFRSRAEVVLGPPLSLAMEPGSPLQRLRTIQRRIAQGLEEVGINVESEEEQARIERLAYAATLGTPRSYFESLKGLERGVPEAMAEANSDLARMCAEHPLLRHQNVPLVPMSARWIYAGVLLIAGPVVLAALALNLPPLVAGWWAGKKFPDGRNVISLWRILVGIPALAIWAAAVLVTLALTGKLLWLGLYVVVTWLGLELYYRVKKLSVAVYNGILFPQMIPRLLAFRQRILDAWPE